MAIASEFELPEGLGDRIREFSIREGVTPFMTMFAAFNVLLHRYSGQTDIAVGVPIANRTQVGVEGLIGTFVNTLVHRNDLSDNPSFHDLLKRVRSVALDAYAHQDLPFERLVRDLSPERDASRTPVFQVLFNMANAPHRVVEFDGLTTEPFEVSRRAAQFDLTVNARIGEQSWIMATFNTDLFDRPTAERLLRNYATLLDAVTRAPRLAIGRIAIMPDDDRRALFNERNDTVAPYPNRAVTALVSAQATRTPAAVAVEFGSVAITYAQLEERSNQLARYLRRRGVTDGALVGVCLNRSAEMVVALLGVLKAGAAYVPIDPSIPSIACNSCSTTAARVRSSPNRRCFGDCPDERRSRCLDRDATEIARETGSPLESSPSLDSRAYVIYTSGSTGNPKGVELSHGALVNFLWSMRETPGLTAADCCWR